MPNEPWTDRDFERGDFDAEIDAMGPGDIEVHEGNPNAKLTVLVGGSAEDAGA